MNKQRKWKAFLIIEGLVQYYFAFSMLSQDIWLKATIGLLAFYFGVNSIEGIWGKEKDLKPVESKLEGK